MAVVKHVVLDLDGVVFNSGRWLAGEWQKVTRRKPNQKRYDFGNPDIMKGVVDMYHKIGIDEVQVFANAVKIINHIIKRGIKVTFATSRDRSVYDRTKIILSKMGFETIGIDRVAELDFIPSDQKAREILETSTSRPVSIMMIDDKFSTLASAVELGMQAAVFDHPWNSEFNATSIKRVVRWEGEDSINGLLLQ